jgi:hypothetical protein
MARAKCVALNLFNFKRINLMVTKKQPMVARMWAPSVVGVSQKGFAL